ncbi:MAG: flavodoxin-dependent (E)-4-hydroxy-3-methylbut-2-enyl-diphosphate synthase [Holophagae bacterium]
MANTVQRQQTHTVSVGEVTIGGGSPIVVQSMTDTPTADIGATAAQIIELVDAGAEIVRLTVNDDEAAAAVPVIRQYLDDAGCRVPLVGDLHFNGHRLLRANPECAASLDKLRINPGNVGRGDRRDQNFAEICSVARDLDLPVRVGVNAGSLDQELVTDAMRENAAAPRPKSSDEVIQGCTIESALRSTEAALQQGLAENRIVISCKVSRPMELVAVYRELSRQTRQPLHLGLTEAGMGTKGLVWSASAMSVLLAEGIGDTIRVSLTPSPGGDRTQEVVAAREILQALGLRRFAPSVTSCPGCGRTSSSVFLDLASRVQTHLDQRLPVWRERFPGSENLTIAVMGCIVNGPGESRHADVGISLPGAGEEPRCPVYVDGRMTDTIEGSADDIADAFMDVVERYVVRRFSEV